jgi:V/A-type H+-transporting ATPase subunit I
MIVDLRKYLVFGPREEMDKFFSLVQKGGFLEFIGLSHKKSLELPENAKKLIAAIKIAKHHIIHPEEAPYLDPERIAEKLIFLQSEQERLSEELRLLNIEIARVGAFGDFNKQELDEIAIETKREIQFYCMKSHAARQMTLPSDMIFITTEYDLDYFCSISKEKLQVPKMIEIFIDRPVGELKSAFLQAREDLVGVEKDLRFYSNALNLLQKGLIDILNDHHLRLAKHDATLNLNEAIFAIEAWVPNTRLKALRSLLGNLKVEYEEILIEPTDKVPTYMENKGVAKIGEDLVHVYDTPSPTDQDPSLWVLISFAFFFAIIIADAGYGLVYFLIALLLKWKGPQNNQFFKRFTKLAFILSSACILWGCATASFFGLEIGPDNPFRKVSFLHTLATKKMDYHIQMKDDVYHEYVTEYPEAASAQNGHDFFLKATKIREGHLKYEVQEEFYDSILMELSLLIGVVHVSLSFLRYLFRNFAGLGWVVFMVGGYLYFPTYLGATSLLNILGLISKPFAASLGLQLLYIGPLLVFIASLIQGKKWMSFHELTNGIQVFSDVLSYLRLYALALAGMVMAATFNDMGETAGLIGGFFILIIGHTINMGLSIMAGAIHGLRLNFLEWYRYSFEGGGRLFNPLRLRKVK